MQIPRAQLSDVPKHGKNIFSKCVLNPQRLQAYSSQGDNTDLYTATWANIQEASWHHANNQQMRLQQTVRGHALLYAL